APQLLPLHQRLDHQRASLDKRPRLQLISAPQALQTRFSAFTVAAMLAGLKASRAAFDQRKKHFAGSEAKAQPLGSDSLPISRADVVVLSGGSLLACGLH